MLRITLGGDAELTIKKDGRLATKAVMAEEVIDILNQTSRYETGFLPPGTRFFKQKGTETAIIMEFPPMRRTMLCDAGGIPVKNVPMPGGVMLLRFNKGSRGEFCYADARIFAVKSTGVRSWDEPLFRFPTSNTGTAGTICWGSSLKHMNVAKLSAVEDYLRLFLSSIFNNHMTERMLNEKFDWKNINVVALIKPYFERIIQHGEFVDDWMVPTQFTLKTAAQNIFYSGWDIG